MYFVIDRIVLAMAPPGQSQAWTSFLPFALILVIFYFLILLPMKRRQKKIQEFQDSLKVGDRVVTTGGIYGTVQGVEGDAVHLRIAENVKVKVARSAVSGIITGESES